MALLLLSFSLSAVLETQGSLTETIGQMLAMWTIRAGQGTCYRHSLARCCLCIPRVSRGRGTAWSESNAVQRMPALRRCLFGQAGRSATGTLQRHAVADALVRVSISSQVSTWWFDAESVRPSDPSWPETGTRSETQHRRSEKRGSDPSVMLPGQSGRCCTC
jgi:hypothetical protein